ncbi:MAG TPA: hypothetical protein VIW03_18405, partial [Anaeromyxobacter sp.]
MRTIALLLCAALAACGSTTNTADDIRATLPTSDALRIDAPDPNASSALTAGGAGAAVTRDGKSELAVLSYVFAATVNWGVASTLVHVHLVTLLPPTSCVEDVSCTWGPGSSATDLNDWMLVVTKVDGGYEWALSGNPKSTPAADFVTVLSGVAYPGARRARGHGSFTADFDAFATLDQPAGYVREYGTMTATYDAQGPLSLRVVWLGGKNQDDPGADPGSPNRADAVYDFDAASRDLVVAWRALPVTAGSAVVTLHTRWQAGGAGRSDVRAVDNPLTYEESECWDG